MPKKVIFRRIKGRLVPIVQKDPSRQIKKNAPVFFHKKKESFGEVEEFKVNVFNKLGKKIADATGAVFRDKKKKIHEAYISFFGLRHGVVKGKGTGKKAFREVAKSLKKRGFKKIVGDISSERQIAIRAKLPTSFYSGGRKISAKEALNTIGFPMGSVNAVTNLEKLRTANTKLLRAEKRGILRRRRRT